MPKVSKVDLTLLKRLVSELESSLVIAEEIKADAGDKHDFIVEMNKAIGLCTGILSESTMLMGDIQGVMQLGGVPSSKTDLLDKLLGGLKGPGNAN